MNEEIKEILDELKHYSYGYDSYDEEKYKINKLLDYITNLQQENERLKENNLAMQEEMARTWEKCDDYKSRIDKAIEMLTYKQNAFSTCFSVCDVINILKGDSDE